MNITKTHDFTIVIDWSGINYLALENKLYITLFHKYHYMGQTKMNSRYISKIYTYIKDNFFYLIKYL